MTTWLKKDLENMLEELNSLSKFKYNFDISYGGYRLETNEGSRTITKNKRYTKQGMGQYLSDLLAYLENEKR